jgi:putative flippase GtrA
MPASAATTHLGPPGLGPDRLGPSGLDGAPADTSGDPNQGPARTGLASLDREAALETNAMGTYEVLGDEGPASHGLWSWFHEGHWMGRWRTPFMVRLWRYGAGSLLAFVSSGVALFICIQWLGFGATTSAVIAFLVGAIPNWVLNRRWAWQKTERHGIAAETTLYAVISLVSLGISVGVTKATAVGAAHLPTHTIVKHLLVTGSYLLTTVALTGAKYLAYDRWVFVDRRPRSRHQVPSTTEVNRAP